VSDLRNCVLVVDDESLIVRLWCIQLETIGFEVCGTAATAEAAIALAQEHRPSIVLMDMRLRGEKDGVDAALAIHESVGSKVIFITGSNEPQAMARIELGHPAAVLLKPISNRQLQSAIEDALRR
jgi:CheY-like chemotaxis protein